MTFEVVNPATGAHVRTVASHSEEEIDERLETAHERFGAWRHRDIEQREALLLDVAEVLRKNEREYAELLVEEMGKPISGALAEVGKCAWVCEYYAESAHDHLAPEQIETDAGESYVTYEPIGPLLAVMPWNFPFWQVFRFAAPHLTAGNVGLLKHASNVPGCAQAIEDVFREAGYPEGVFQTLLIGSGRVKRVLTDDRVRAATLTGSEYAGRAVGETAGHEIKKTVLELGGSDPFIVLDDADLGRAAEIGARARCINSGQSCIAAKRFIVHERVYDDFLDSFVAEMKQLKIGDPMSAETEVGPQTREDLMDDLHDQVERTIGQGATIALGGSPVDRDGFYYPPTVLTDVEPGMVAATEELFGPVAAVMQAADDEEAVSVANDSRFGLGASLWTEDHDRARRLAREIEAGSVFVNSLVKSDPRMPFGGVKNSGYGRELGRHGIREFVNSKTNWIDQ